MATRRRRTLPLAPFARRKFRRHLTAATAPPTTELRRRLAGRVA